MKTQNELLFDILLDAMLKAISMWENEPFGSELKAYCKGRFDALKLALDTIKVLFHEGS